MTGANVEPLALPEDYNPDIFMLVKETEYGTFHESRKAAGLAAALVANGTAEDLTLAEKVLEAVLRCQELDTADPHYGNFYWMREDTVVEDLNAVEFVLENLIPMMIQHGDRLSPELHHRVRESIRLGLAEILRLDVLVAYTNITGLDIRNTCLGGELLADAAIAAHGYQKLVKWIAFTNESGHLCEYNSPTYGAVTMRALKRLADLVQDEETRARTKAFAARIALSAALHIHPLTGRWAGPHGRAYQPTVVCETPPEIEMIRRWIEEGIMPSWISDILDRQMQNVTITETAHAAYTLGLSTWLGSSFALGVASKGFGPQANSCLVHYHRPESDRAGVLYTRYIFDDKWFGDTYHATDRTKTRNLPDEGEFFGVQRQNQALGIYSPGSFRQGKSAKAAFIWTDRAQVDEIWVGERRIDQLPVTVQPEETVVVGSGSLFMAVRPLSISPLGRATPIQLVERDGDLVLEMVNYKGARKYFWELNWPGAFYKGKPICSFYLEVTERSQFEDGRSFSQEIETGTFNQNLAPSYTYPAEGERPYTLSYRRGHNELGMSIDLMEWQLMRRWTEAGDLGWEMLASPVARQNATGRVEVGEAILTCNDESAWLYANPDTGRWVAGYLGLTPTTLLLSTPQGSVTVDRMGMGTAVWDNGEVMIEAAGDFTIKIDQDPSAINI